MDDRPDSQVSGERQQEPCDICGRTFLPERLARHAKICERQVTKAPRKVFNTQKQRLQGTEMEQVQKTGKMATAAKPPKTKKNWRKEHEEFIAAIRNARQVTVALQTGGPLPPPAPPAENPDYVKCDFCSRRFRQEAAERHIPFCREKAQRVNPGKPVSEQAKEKLTKRNAYKVPLPGKKRTSLEEAGQATGNGGYEYSPPGARAGAAQRAGPSSQRGAAQQQQQPQQQPQGATSRAGAATQRGGAQNDRKPAAGPGKSGIPQRRPPMGPPGARTNGQGSGGAQSTATQPRGAAQPRPGMQRVSSRNVPAGSDHGNGSERSSYAQRQQQQQQAPPESQPFVSRRGHQQRRPAAGAGASTSQHGMNSTYTLRNGATSGNGNDYGEMSPATERLATARPQHQQYDNHHDYDGHDYQDTPTQSGLGASSSTSGFSELSSEVSLPPITSSRGMPSKGPRRASNGSSNGGVATMSKFCYNCGMQFPVPHAKYCCECGTKRIAV